MKGVRGRVKNLVFKKVKSVHCLIGTPLHFAQYATKSVNSY